MTAMTDSGDRACGHPAPPDALFCPVCGRPTAYSAGPSQSEPDPWASWFAPPRSPSGPQSWPTPPDDPQPWAAGPDATRADGPFGDSPTDLFESLRSAAAPAGPRRRPNRRLVVAVAAAALVAVVAAFVVMQSLSSGSAASSTTGPVATASSPDARRQAAVRLAGLLALSGTDRAAVTRAAEDVRGCGPSLHQDAQVFAHSAGSRQQLLARLATLSGRSALPAVLLADLTSAWQASAQVDSDLARWAQDNIARGCRHGSRSDTYLRASAGPEDQATVGKRAFATGWNAIAGAYGLTTYQPSQL